MRTLAKIRRLTDEFAEAVYNLFMIGYKETGKMWDDIRNGKLSRPLIFLSVLLLIIIVPNLFISGFGNTITQTIGDNSNGNIQTQGDVNVTVNNNEFPQPILKSSISTLSKELDNGQYETIFSMRIYYMIGTGYGNDIAPLIRNTHFNEFLFISCEPVLGTGKINASLGGVGENYLIFNLVCLSKEEITDTDGLFEYYVKK